MGLQNLKSIFTKGLEKFNKSDLTSLDSKYTQGATEFNKAELTVRTKNSPLSRLDSDFDNGVGEYITPSSPFNSEYDNVSIPTFENIGNQIGNSLFNNDINGLIDIYESNRPQDTYDSKIGFDPNGTNEWNNVTIYSTHQGDGGLPMITPVSAPILDTLLRQPPSFVSNDLTIKHYTQENFDSRIPKNDGIQINNINTYAGSILYPHNTNTIERFGSNGFVTTDYSSAGQGQGFQGSPFIPLSELGLDLGTSEGWPSLYKEDHSPLIINNPDPNNPFKPYIYGGNVNRDKLNIRGTASDAPSNLFSPSRTQVLGQGAGEPYIISPIPRSDTDNNSGRFRNAGSQEFPIIRSTLDTIRISKFLTSPAGIAFVAKQNINSFTNTAVIRAGDDLYRVPQMFNKFYFPASTLATINPMSRQIGIAFPKGLYRRDSNQILDDVFGEVSYINRIPRPNVSGFTGRGEYNWASRASRDTTIDDVNAARNRMNESTVQSGFPDWDINQTFKAGLQDSDENTGITGVQSGTKTLLDAIENSVNLGMFTVFSSSGGEVIPKTNFGDKMTLAKMIRGTHMITTNEGTITPEAQGSATAKEKIANTTAVNIEAEKEGMPFYFKDLRTLEYVFFRAYLQDIVENVVPTWNPTTYVGRSSPVYTYQSTERDIGFTLKLYANTESELNMIYTKLNKLTSLCYPQYSKDLRMSSKLRGGKNINRMKPPLTQLRVGELYGNEKGNLLGFLETINYTVEQTATWETKKGKRVPKYVLATIAFRVIYSHVPDAFSNFYGLNKG